MQNRPFLDLGCYPQFSLSATDVWSDPLVGGVGCNFRLPDLGGVLRSFPGKRNGTSSGLLRDK